MVYIRLNPYRRIPGKWDVVNTKFNTHDVCPDFKTAIEYFLWNLGMSPKKAFNLFKKNKDS